MRGAQDQSEYRASQKDQRVVYCRGVRFLGRSSGDNDELYHVAEHSCLCLLMVYLVIIYLFIYLFIICLFIYLLFIYLLFIYYLFIIYLFIYLFIYPCMYSTI